MKQTIAIIILSILLTIAGVFGYNQYTKAKTAKLDHDNLITTLTGENLDWKNKYNTALVTISNKDIEVSILDAKLKKEIGKKPTVIEHIQIRTVILDTQSGVLKPIIAPISDGTTTPVSTPTMYVFHDFRLDAIADTKRQTFKYELHQDLGINVYRLSETVFKAEVLEYKDNVFYKSYPIDPGKMKVDLVLNKPKGLQTGFNLMLGAGLVISTENANVDYTVHGMGNFISYGVSHLDSDVRFLSIGAGSKGLLLSPASWRVSNVIPLLSDMFLDTLVIEPYALGKPLVGVGVSSTF
jgi:hypothetical protein